MPVIKRPSLNLTFLGKPSTGNSSAKPLGDDGNINFKSIAYIVILLAFIVAGAFALHRLNLRHILHEIVGANVLLLIASLGLMMFSMCFRAASWRIILHKCLEGSKLSFLQVFNAICAGVFVSAASPLRLGEVARALVISRHTAKPNKSLPIIAGTIISQTFMNIVALIMLGASLLFITISGLKIAAIQRELLISLSIAAVAAIVILITLKQKKSNFIKDTVRRLLTGLNIFKYPLPALAATFIQMMAWIVQTLACMVLIKALHIHVSNLFVAGAATLFAVNVSAILPVTPSNIGPFQAACVVVLSGVFGVNGGVALAYGVILQAVEVITAISLGVFSLSSESLSLKSLREQSQHTTV